MSDLQKEAVTASKMGRTFAAISKVFDAMPNRFTMRELLALASIKDRVPTRWAVAACLFRDFKCTNVSKGSTRIWVKKGATK